MFRPVAGHVAIKYFITRVSIVHFASLLNNDAKVSTQSVAGRGGPRAPLARVYR